MIGVRFSDNKAGMNSVDREFVERIITENTGAEFGSYERKRAKRIDARIQRNQQMLSELSEAHIREAEIELDKIIAEMEGRRRLDKVRVHVDMDAFYAAVECRDDPRLRTIPMAVGSDSMLSTSNYLARKFGVRSAMPGFIGKKLCPKLFIVRGNFSKYRSESSVFQRVLQRYDPEVSMGGLDEAYLDITDHISERKTPVCCKRVRYSGQCVCRLPLVVEESEQISENAEKNCKLCVKCGKEQTEVIDSVEFGMDVESAVQQLRFEVEQATGLTCSAGVAPNSMLSKICSDLNKPNGQFRLQSCPDAIISFMRSLPIRKVPGIGAVSEALLKAIGVSNCGDLFDKRAIIRLIFSRHSSEWFLRISLGLSSRDVMDEDSVEEQQVSKITFLCDNNPKSSSVERTFVPTKNLDELLFVVHKLCLKLVKSLQPGGIVGGRSATLKIKFSNFDVITRCISVNFVISMPEQLFPIMETLLRKEMKEKNMPIRLLGVRLGHLTFEDENNPKNGLMPKREGIQTSLAKFVLKPSKKRNDRIELVELGSSIDELAEDANVEEPMVENEESNTASFGQKRGTDQNVGGERSETTTQTSAADGVIRRESMGRGKMTTSPAEDKNVEDEVIFVEEVNGTKRKRKTEEERRRGPAGRANLKLKGKKKKMALLGSKVAGEATESRGINNLHKYFSIAH